ncbi:MAG: beta-galactosidase [Verrucomicrobiae bacterium]|nr:beta-galactosidase [Verrucomicrobiae bacterium]
MKVAVSFYAKWLSGESDVFVGFQEGDFVFDGWWDLWRGSIPKELGWHLMKAEVMVPVFLHGETVLRLRIGLPYAAGPYAKRNAKYLLDDVSMEVIEAGHASVKPKRAVVHSFDKDDARDEASRYGVYWTPWKRWGMASIAEPRQYDKTKEEIINELDLMERIGIKWIRSLWRWDKVEWEKGNYDFALLDYVVAEAWKRGIRFVPCLATPPRWASTAPESAPDFRAYPPKREAWANFVQRMVDHFKDKIKYWEIWNEPNLPNYWIGTALDYYELVKAASTSAKRADPRCKILMGGFAWTGREYVTNLLKLGAKDHFDILSCHPYPGKRGADRVNFMTRSLRLVLAQHNCEYKPIWFTEIGWSVREAGDFARQAKLLTDLYSYPLDEAVGKIFWFCFDNWYESPGRHYSGLISTYGGKTELHDAYRAYGKATGKLIE